MSGRLISRLELLGSLLVIAVVSTGISALWAQEQQEEVQYTQEEYNLYSDAVGNPNLQARQEAILEFIKANPKSSLNQYAIGSYIQAMQELQTKGEHAQVIAAGEKFLSVVDGDNPGVLQLTTLSAFQTQKYDKSALYGVKLEKVATEKVPWLNFILAKSFQGLNNEAQFMDYGERACSEYSPKDCLDLLPGLMRGFAARKDWKKAANYAEKTIEAIDATSKPAHLEQKQWDEFAKEEKAAAYSLIGKNAAENKRWAVAEQNYKKALETKPNPARNAEAYYYIGMAAWNKGLINPAMEAFARGSVQRGTPVAESCRKNLEQLYRSTHNDSLAGLDEFIKRAVQ